MTWLIACERSGVIRDAMLAAGVDAVSCDLEPSDAPGPHILGDVIPQLQRRWAGVIAHPPCTYLANAGVQHLYIGRDKKNGLNAKRMDDMCQAAAFFNEFPKANAPHIAIENPIMHGYAKFHVGWPSQVVHPWWFGDPLYKRTCWWLYGLPLLRPTCILDQPDVGTDEDKAWRRMHNRGQQYGRDDYRSKMTPGHAAAITQQWALLTERIVRNQ